uniref:Uncharacterized protein n=1 Tax=Timema cristinae TaxID=61476 RepID=A0A7R9CTM6_TIMCR|nr:unnamed protein product [Timema cristinae]
MSPTEFSNYIKQRALQQQIHHHHPHHHHQPPPPSQASPTGRSLSPNSAPAPDPTGYFFQPGPYPPQFGPQRGLFEPYMSELYPPAAAKFPTSSYLDPQQFYNTTATGGSTTNSAPTPGGQDNKQLLEGLNNFTPYPPSPFQHLLVAN